MGKCSRCRKKLTDGEDKYCSRCVARITADRERRASTDHYRPCRACNEPMKNPSPNRQRCPSCVKLRRIETWKAQEKKRVRCKSGKANANYQSDK